MSRDAQLPAVSRLANRNSDLFVEQALNEFSQQERSLFELVKLFRTYWKRILLAVAGCVACGVVFQLLAPKYYSSSVTLKIGNYTPLIQGGSEEALKKESSESGYRQTLIATLSSVAVADKVLSEKEIAERVEGISEKASSPSLLSRIFGSKKKPTEPVASEYHHSGKLLGQYLQLIKVSPVSDTSLVKILATSDSPSLSYDIAELHAQKFIQFIKEERQKSMMENLAFLQAQGEELQKKVAEAESKVASYVERHGLIPFNDNNNPLSRELSELTSLKNQATAERIKTEALLREIKSSKDVNLSVLDDESIRDLKVALQEAEAQQADYREKFTNEYPKVRELGAKITSLKTTIQQSRAQALKALEAKYQGYLGAETKLDEQINLEKAQLNQDAQKLVTYNVLQREYESLKDLYQNVLREIKELQVSTAGIGSNVTVVEHALFPDGPSSPKFSVVLIFCIALGLVGGFVTVLLKELFDTSIKGADEVDSLLHLGLLGAIPSLNASQVKAQKRDLLPAPENVNPPPSLSPALRESFVTVYSPCGPESEAFRAVRASILFSSAERAPKTIIVTSPKKGDGKTTLACNLAVTLAQAGFKTLLIDGDMRQPQVGRRFGVKSRASGLSDIIVGQADPEEVIRETSVSLLSILSAGPATPNPAELIGSRKMAELLESFANFFDHIIIDMPPVLAVADSLMLSPSVDGVVMVIRSGHTERALATEAVRRLRAVRAPLLGVVLNDLSPSHGIKGSYHMLYGQGYYGEENGEDFAADEPLSRATGS